MGNRAFLYSEKIAAGQRGLGVYLHWNGGPDSVIPLIKYCKLRRFRPFSDGYGVARLCQVMGNFFGGTLSLGVEFAKPGEIDTNHTPYCITDNWEIKNIDDYRHDEWPTDEQVYEFMVELNKCQPKELQVPLEFLTSEKPSLDTLKVGDTVYWFDDVYERYKKAKVAKTPGGKPAIRRYTCWKENVNCLLENLDFRKV